MEFDYCRLLGKITEKTGTQANFAKKMQISERSVSLKLNNKVAFKQDEIMRACETLDIPNAEIGKFFFTEKVQLN